MSHRVWSAEVRDLGDRIVTLTVARAAELREYLEAIHGVKPVSRPVVVPPRDAGPVPDTPRPEPTEFDVRLEGFEPARKIALVKTLREMTGFGVKEAVVFLNACPRLLKERVPREEARELQARLESAGARITLQGCDS